MEYPAAGKCRICKEDLVRKVRSWTYMCPKDGYSTEKEGNCAVCGEPLNKNLVIYLCLTCRVSQGEPGKCPMCKQDLKKIELRVMGKSIKEVKELIYQ
jgi:predicted amidophosphoribosyltransferase